MRPLDYLRQTLIILLTGIAVWGLYQWSTPARGGTRIAHEDVYPAVQAMNMETRKPLKTGENSKKEDQITPSSRSPLLQSYHRVRGKAVYRAPTQEEGLAVRVLVEQILDCARSSGACEGLNGQAELLHLRIDSMVSGDQRYVLLAEEKGHERGWGAYLFRTGSVEKEWIIQAPHTFYDEGTGILGLELFETYPMRAFYFNTIHRYASRQLPSNQSSQTNVDALQEAMNSPHQIESDVAHNPAHPFQRATEAVRTLEKPVVIQLHGFRETLRTGSASLIISGGRRMPMGGVAARMVDGLSAGLEGVKRYPDEIRALGGERNVQAQLLNGWPGCTFVHLELSAALRKLLLEQSVQRQRWAEAVWAAR